MKFKKWLREYHQLSYSDYKALPEFEGISLWSDFYIFNIEQNRAKQIRENFIRSGGIIRPATEAEIELVKIMGEKERVRHETSRKIGGLDERGNYTALSHRWENRGR